MDRTSTGDKWGPGADYILLVEDNDDDAFLTERAFRSAGIELPIERSPDGQATLDFFLRLDQRMLEQENVHLPAFVLLDLKLPRLSGLDVLHWIRHHEVFHPTVVLALTSSSELQDVGLAYQLKINGYLVKPSSISEMTRLAQAIAGFWLEQAHLIRPPVARLASSSA